MRTCIYIFILLCSSWDFIICLKNVGRFNATEHAQYLYYEYTRNIVGDIVYWYINSAPSTTINLTLVESTWTSTPDCQTDHLRIRESGSPLKKICGSNSSTIQSYSNRVIVFFYSVTGCHATFRLRYRQMRPCNVTIVPDGPKYANEGETIILSCISDCPNPVRYSWFHYSHKSRARSYLSVDKSHGYVTVNQATRNLSGFLRCTAIHDALTDDDTGYRASKSVNITVFYQSIIENFQINNQSPSVYVNERDRVDVICSVDSKPASTIELRNNTNQIKVVHNSTRIQFAWKEARCEDSNIYFCTADNSVNERVKKQIELFVNCHPRLNHHKNFMSSFTTQLGNDAVLHISVIAFPPPVFTWYKLVNGKRTFLKKTECVKTNSWSSVGQLILYKTKREDAGDYQVVVSSEKFDTKLVKKMKLFLRDSTQDMKMIYIGAGAGGAVLLVVVVLIILVFVLIGTQTDDDLQRNTRTGNENLSVVPDYLEMETDDDIQRNRRDGNENVSVDPDYFEIESENRDHSRNSLDDSYLVAPTSCDDAKTGSTKRDKNTLEEDYLEPCPPENYFEYSTDNKELRDSYSTLEAERSEQHP